MAAGAAAGSGALVAFGIDSGIEVFAAAVVLWRLRGGEDDDREQRALRLIGLSFFALAAYVAIDAAVDLLGGDRPDTSTVGIVLAAVSVVVMPALAVAKQRVGTRMGDPVVVADATETALCAYLSGILLAGLGLHAWFGWWWADPVAALGIAALAVREGREAWEGDHEHHHP